MTSIKCLYLYYFPFEGRISPVRDSLRIGQINYKDVTISFEQFREKKQAGEFPFGALPVMDVETAEGMTRVAESNAMLRFAGRLSGLYPVDDALQALKVDEVLDMAEDINNLLTPSFYEEDMARKMAMRKVLADDTLPCWIGYIDKLLQANGNTGFIVGNRLSVADLKLYWLMDFLTNGSLDGIPTTILESEPAVVEYRKSITTARDKLLASAS